MNKTMKLIAKGTIIFFAGVGVGQTYNLIKPIKEIFEPKEQGPSATNTKKIEELGHDIDKILGLDKSWDETSGNDTYGESLSGNIDALLSGEYKSAKPSNEELKGLINKDLKKVIYKVNLIKETKDLSYLENLDKVVSIFFVGDYKLDKTNEAAKIIDENIDFILNNTKYKNKNITFKELDNETQLYFMKTLLKMDTVLKEVSSLYDYEEILNSNQKSK
ncbi:MAG: hypothetical protein RR745_02445 [Bacilli bacterium]